jgi:hypothetical protein
VTVTHIGTVGLAIVGVIVTAAIAAAATVAAVGGPNVESFVILITMFASSAIAAVFGFTKIVIGLHKQMNSLKDELVESTRRGADAKGYARRRNEEEGGGHVAP